MPLLQRDFPQAEEKVRLPLPVRSEDQLEPLPNTLGTEEVLAERVEERREPYPELVGSDLGRGPRGPPVSAHAPRVPGD